MRKKINVIGGVMLGIVLGGVGVGKLMLDSIEERNDKVDKFKEYYNILNQWLLIRQEGMELSKYFLDNNISSIAIYGMGELGNRLYAELKCSTVDVKYVIDQNVETVLPDIKVIGIDEPFPKVDAIVVTPVFAFEMIQEELKNKTDIKLMSIEDIVYEI
ncbi:MAG: hypothetical protein J6A03_00745 [Lachnospiraceae bacterium]|nr:hypothetical protein [Lachnospiraceae bacterium]